MDLIASILTTFRFLVPITDHTVSLNFSRHLPLVFFIRASRRIIYIDISEQDVTLSLRQLGVVNY